MASLKTSAAKGRKLQDVLSLKLSFNSSGLKAILTGRGKKLTNALEMPTTNYKKVLVHSRKNRKFEQTLQPQDRRQRLILSLFFRNHCTLLAICRIFRESKTRKSTKILRDLRLTNKEHRLFQIGRIQWCLLLLQWNQG